MRRLWALGFGAVVTLCGAPRVSFAAAPWDTVQDLYEHCQASTTSYLYTDCLAFISGVGSAMNVTGQFASEGAMYATSICSKEGITNGALVQAFKNWAAANPSKWTMDGGQGVMIALVETWPCSDLLNK